MGCGQSVPDIDIINLAASTGDIEAVKQYLDAGGDVNAKNKVTTTPLYWAAYEGQKEIVELLIANGADVNAKSNRGYTPLHEASDHGKTEIIELLIAKGADVNAIIVSGRNHGKTPLDLTELTKLQRTSKIKAAKKQTADLLRKHGGKTAEEL